MDSIKSSSILKMESLATSDGNQIKYNYKDLIVKIDTNYEGLAESLITKFLEAINYPYSFIEYTPCLIEDNGVVYKGCKCKDCLIDEDEDESLYEILLQNKLLYCFNDIKYSAVDKFRIATEMFTENMKEELISTLFIDCIVLNADRHLNNIRIINSSNGVRLFPAFDFGDSLLQGSLGSMINGSNSLNLVRKAKCKPFCNSIKTQFKLCQSLNCKIEIPPIVKLSVSNLYEYYDKNLVFLMIKILRQSLSVLDFNCKIEIV